MPVSLVALEETVNPSRVTADAPDSVDEAAPVETRSSSGVALAADTTKTAAPVEVTPSSVAVAAPDTALVACDDAEIPCNALSGHGKVYP